MRYSLVVSITVGLASAALATVAMAQQPLNEAGIIHQPVSTPPGVSGESSYDWHMTMLKRKMERLTREDGGQLSASHQANLQKELDALNLRYGARPQRLGPKATL
jgi:hypothetical protein